MSARFDLFTNELATRFSKRFAAAAVIIDQSSLAESTRGLVNLTLTLRKGSR
ncbi:hypothetical protein [Nocardia mangyaensis]|nr:hypothetical protein [Nocardia mangyaensis]